MIALLGYDERLEFARAEGKRRLERHQGNPRLIERAQDEIAEALRIDDIEHLQTIRLPPDDRLFAEPNAHPVGPILSEKLAQLGFRMRVDLVTPGQRVERVEMRFTRLEKVLVVVAHPGRSRDRPAR